MSAILKSIAGHFDRSNNTLWFDGELVSGAHFQVGFPIAHVAVVFDNKMAAQNFIADPICGAIVDVNGFLGNYEAVCNCGNAGARRAARSAYDATLSDLGNHAIHYALSGHDAVCGSLLSKAWGSVKSTAKAAVHVATAPARAAVNVGKAAVTGQNVLKAVQHSAESLTPGITRPLTSSYNIAKAAATGQNVATAIGKEGKLLASDLRGNIKKFQTTASFVPGIGTLASVSIGVTQAGLEGKSLTEIVKAAGVSAIPGGPLAQQIALAAINTVQAGVEGKNVLQAAAQQTIKAVSSAIPDPSARALIERVALDAAAGKNVLTSTEHAALETAIALIPNAAVQQAARGAISGNLNLQSALEELARGAVGNTVSADGVAKVVAGSATNLKALGPAGLSLLSNARDELIEVSSNFVPDATARATLRAAIASARTGKAPGNTAQIQAALTKVTDLNARSVLATATKSQDPEQLLAAAGGKYLATLVHLDPQSHIAKAIVQGQNVVTRPSGITAPVRMGGTPVAAPAVKISTTPLSSNRFRAIGARGLFDWRTALRG